MNIDNLPVGNLPYPLLAVDAGRWLTESLFFAACGIRVRWPPYISIDAVCADGGDEMSDGAKREFRESWERIVLYARRRGLRHKDWVASKGHDTGELEAWALVNAVWIQVENRTVAWNPGRQSFYHFYCGRIDALAHNIERRARRHDTVGQVDSTEIDYEDPRSLRDLLDSIETNDLLGFIENRNSKLKELAVLLLADASKEEIELRLGISDDTRVRWQKKLAALVRDHLRVPDYGVQAS